MTPRKQRLRRAAAKIAASCLGVVDLCRHGTEGGGVGLGEGQERGGPSLVQRRVSAIFEPQPAHMGAPRSKAPHQSNRDPYGKGSSSRLGYSERAPAACGTGG